MQYGKFAKYLPVKNPIHAHTQTNTPRKNSLLINLKINDNNIHPNRSARKYQNTKMDSVCIPINSTDPICPKRQPAILETAPSNGEAWSKIFKGILNKMLNTKAIK